MNGRKEYKVGEIFWHGGVVYQCVPDSNGDGHCNNCAMEMWCDYKPYACCSFERSDNTWVHYVKVTEPEEGMLFRASDGKLYELKKLENFECGCYIIGYTNCTVISYEAFGEDILDVFHWYPVDEKKEMKGDMMDFSKIELQKVYMKRHLELAVVAIENDIVTFKVADQFYDENEFCGQHNKSDFKAKNGIAICLSEKLKWDRNNKILSIRRLHDIIKVEETTKCYVHHFAYIMEAVTEYNETDGKGYENPWPQYGDKYFCIQSTGYVTSTDYDNHPIDNDRREFGNFFRTREEAKAALERVKKSLKGE